MVATLEAFLHQVHNVFLSYGAVPCPFKGLICDLGVPGCCVGAVFEDRILNFFCGDIRGGEIIFLV